MKFFAKVKNAIELASEVVVADTLRETAELGQFDAFIEQQARFGRRVTQQNKLTETTEERLWIKHVFFVLHCASGECANY